VTVEHIALDSGLVEQVRALTGASTEETSSFIEGAIRQALIRRGEEPVSGTKEEGPN